MPDRGVGSSILTHVSLHPDKLIALSRIAYGASPTEREPPPSSTVEQRAINAAKTRRSQALPKEPGSIESLAFDMRDAHWANHLSRLKKRVSKATAETPTKPPTPQIVFQLPGQPNA